MFNLAPSANAASPLHSPLQASHLPCTHFVTPLYAPSPGSYVSGCSSTPPDTPALLHRSSGSRSSPDISFAPFSLAPGRCSTCQVLINFQFYQLSSLLRSSTPTNGPLAIIFRKLVGITLSFTLTFTVFLQRNTLSLSLSSAAALFTSLTLNAPKFSISFSCVKRQPRAWWSPLVENVVKERCKKTIATAHRKDENCQACIFASRHSRFSLS